MIYSQMRRGDEPPPSLGVVLTAILFSFGFAGLTLVFMAIVLLVEAATKLANLWHKHQGRRKR
jgi:hypothetical protein